MIISTCPVTLCDVLNQCQSKTLYNFASCTVSVFDKLGKTSILPNLAHVNLFTRIQQLKIFMHFEVIAKCPTTKARVSRMKLAHGVTMLPTFMPVATQAAIKGLTPEQVESLGVTLILNNTYHLNLRPGLEVLNKVGGAHKFQGWERNLLTVFLFLSYPELPQMSFYRIAAVSNSFR